MATKVMVAKAEGTEVAAEEVVHENVEAQDKHPHLGVLMADMEAAAEEDMEINLEAVTKEVDHGEAKVKVDPILGVKAKVAEEATAVETAGEMILAGLTIPWAVAITVGVEIKAAEEEAMEAETIGVMMEDMETKVMEVNKEEATEVHQVVVVEVQCVEAQVEAEEANVLLLIR